MTTEIMTSIARPYGKAAFEYALSHNDMLTWENMLTSAALVANDKKIKRLLTSPKVRSKQLADLFCDVLHSVLDPEKKNFIYLLAENNRLSVLPEIATAFKELRAEYEKTLTVQVASAIPLDETYQQKLIQALTKRLKKKIVLENHIEESLLGGIKISAGDLVLDGSIRGKLDRLSEFI